MHQYIQNVQSLFQAVRDNDLPAVTRIISTSPRLVHARNEDNWTPLHGSSYYGHGDICSLLLLHGAELEAVTPAGNTPLMFAVQENHGDVCSILLSHGANVNYIRPSTDTTPLMLAVQENHGEVCSILLSHGANVNYIRPSDGFTPLHSAVQYGYVDLCDLLTIVSIVSSPTRSI